MTTQRQTGATAKDTTDDLRWKTNSQKDDNDNDDDDAVAVASCCGMSKSRGAGGGRCNDPNERNQQYRLRYFVACRMLLLVACNDEESPIVRSAAAGDTYMYYGSLQLRANNTVPTMRDGNRSARKRGTAAAAKMSSTRTTARAATSRAIRTRAATRTTRKPFNLKLWLSSAWDDVQASLFFSPLLAVVVAICLAVGLIRLDEKLTANGGDARILPLSTTVESARSVLSTLAGATIGFAGTAFSLSLLVFQMGSSTYSPRLVHTLFRDPYNRRVMAFTLATFAYCVVVMRSVGSTTSKANANASGGGNGGTGGYGAMVVPNVSLAVAMILGILSILSIVAFIDHCAHSLDISELMHRVNDETLLCLKRVWKLPEELEEPSEQQEEGGKGTTTGRDVEGSPGSGSAANDTSEKDPGVHWKEIPTAHVVRFRHGGWVQEINLEALKVLVPQGGFIKLHVTPGRYALPGSAACSVGKLDGDGDDEYALEAFDASVLDTIAVGRSRTMRDDPSFGLRQLVDVTLKALSPGVNDPTTAQEGIFHAAAVVIEFLKREPPPSVIRVGDGDGDNGGELILGERPTHDGIVRLAYNEIRVCAASSPTVGLYLIESLRLIRESLAAVGLEDRAPEIERQVQLVEANCRKVEGHVQHDRDFIARVRADRFPDLMPIEIANSPYRDALISGAGEEK